jgi:hypothetical protein
MACATCSSSSCSKWGRYDLNSYVHAYYVNIVHTLIWRDTLILLWPALVVAQVQAKVSHPGARNKLDAALNETLTDLEMSLPLYWNSMVRHVWAHWKEILEKCGPYTYVNMLNFERWNKTAKSFGRGTRDVLGSFDVNYRMWEASNAKRDARGGQRPGGLRPAQSTASALLAREPAHTRGTGAMLAKGAVTGGTLTDEEFKQVEDLWTIEVPAFGDLRTRYKR